jgi:hypothetical protein
MTSAINWLPTSPSLLGMSSLASLRRRPAMTSPVGTAWKGCSVLSYDLFEGFDA